MKAPKASRMGVHKLLQKYYATGTVVRCAESGRPWKATETMGKIVDEQMRRDDKTMANQLQKLPSDSMFL